MTTHYLLHLTQAALDWSPPTSDCEVHVSISRCGLWVGLVHGDSATLVEVTALDRPVDVHRKLDRVARGMGCVAPTSFRVPDRPFGPACSNCDGLGVVFTAFLPDGSKEDIPCGDC